MNAAASEQPPAGAGELKEEAAHYLGHRQRLRERFILK